MDIAHLYRKCPTGVGRMYAWFSAMHTRVDILFLSPADEDTLLGIVYEVRRAINDIELLANAYNRLSQLARVNREAARHPVVVDEELMLMLRICKTYNQQSEGLFDVTVGSTPGPDIDALRLGQAGDVRFAHEGLQVNLSGFLKGYALDAIRHLLHLHDVPNAIVSLGQSSMMAIGHAGGIEGGWPINVGDQRVTLKDACLTTSGNDSPQRRHIMNPLTGNYTEGHRSVTVVTPTGIEGEVLSTSLFLADDVQRRLLTERFALTTVIDLAGK